MSNNFYICDRKKDWRVVAAVLRSGVASQLPAKFSSHAAGTEATVLEKLFQYSVFWAATGDSDSLEIVKWLLISGQDPNQIGNYRDAQKRYPSWSQFRAANQD